MEILQAKFPGNPEELEVFRNWLEILNRARIPYLIGGAFAVYLHTGIWRDTKDLDVFIQPRDLRRALDAFAGAGIHITKEHKEFIPGSPLNALILNPQFDEYHFIDIDREKTQHLRTIVEEFENKESIFIYEGDCNHILLEKVFPRCRYEDYHRALCILDPYGLHLDWTLIKKAGDMGSVEIFLNFPVADMNRNVLWHDTNAVTIEQKLRMTRFWGDETWKEAAYHKECTLFEEINIKNTNETIAECFRLRLKEVAGFDFVLEPMPMRNSTGAIIYYLFFAANQPVSNKIVKEIFANNWELGLEDGN